MPQRFLERASGALEERLDALRGADERHHDQHADGEQHRLQDVRGGVVEAEQDGERPAEMTVMTLGQTISRVEAEAGCGLMERVLIKGRNLSEKPPSIKRKRPKNAASRDIDCRIFSRKRREL